MPPAPGTKGFYLAPARDLVPARDLRTKQVETVVKAYPQSTLRSQASSVIYGCRRQVSSTAVVILERDEASFVQESSEGCDLSRVLPVDDEGGFLMKVTDTYHSFLVLSFVEETRVLSVGLSFTDVTDSVVFQPAVSTLACSVVNDGMLVQIQKSAVRLCLPTQGAHSDGVPLPSPVCVSIMSCISDSVEDDDHLFMQLDAIYQTLAIHKKLLKFSAVPPFRKIVYLPESEDDVNAAGVQKNSISGTIWSMRFISQDPNKGHNPIIAVVINRAGGREEGGRQGGGRTAGRRAGGREEGGGWRAGRREGGDREAGRREEAATGEGGRREETGREEGGDREGGGRREKLRK
ncbi:hypothetical protein ACLB2K_059029 [Fragaria x ananassa]